MAAALTAAGRTSDVYDFDTQGREAPHHLGVLSHYDAVLWETGDDIILRAPGQVAGTTMKAALDIELSVRDYLNEGGKALVSGKYALYAQAANGAYFYNPNAPAEPECTDPDDLVCLPVLNDFLQYWLGAYTYIDGGGTGPTARPTRWSGSPTRTPGGRPHARRKPGPHRVVPADVELPAAGGVPVVRTELGPGRLGTPGRRTLRAAQRRLAPVQWPGRRVVQAADPHGRPHRRRPAGSFGSSPPMRRRPIGTTCSSRRARSAPTTWTTLPDVNGHTDTDTGLSCPEGWIRSCTRSWPTTRPRRGTDARRPAPPAAGTRPPGPQPAPRSGPST